MLNQPTIEKLHNMKPHGMADAVRTQIETPDASQLGFEERFAMLVDQRWLSRNADVAGLIPRPTGLLH